jgi:hypothetical protein
MEPRDDQNTQMIPRAALRIYLEKDQTRETRIDEDFWIGD